MLPSALDMLVRLCRRPIHGLYIAVWNFAQPLALARDHESDVIAPPKVPV
jgi:hypothetical protein